MALRLDQAIIRGEIDNTSRGNVRGKLWLVGHDEPITLDLRGNAWRDVAGCKITFTNPRPAAQDSTALLQPKQTGYVGDITASRKVRVISNDSDIEETSELEEQAVTEWSNTLYLEWFSEENGRVFIESADFETGISAWVWEMDPAEEEAQKMTNLHTMRGWLAGIIQRPDPQDEEDDSEEFDDSEEAWESSLKQSDRLSDAHMEALEKYGTEGLHDDRVAFVIGWDHMLGGDSPRETENDGESWKAAAETDPHAFDEEDFDQWLEEEESKEDHPLQKRAQELVIRLLNEIDEQNDESSTNDDNTPLDRFIRNTMNISGKLAGALGMGGFPGSENNGYILAILRRCLNWANEALAALKELMESPAWQERLDLLGEYRAELFALRDGITDLRKELREK
jgi:hypothetical protein